ncbi:GAF domain-containing protein [Spirosoma rhododendri]|uniref:GAF domain-containing protein n=1 Tax=Spirosoma rhododendri TaxID=2728024 RepID=A0A7L5DSI3_9BACT|nr:GAF domain-containing protein [Spirosoma rhododendri]QJD80213.1 GAF domain-containing protein [Spirosoma rhododendri]
MNAIDTLTYTVTELINQGQPPGPTLDAIVACVGQSLDADRCFLYVRRPALGLGRTAFCWRRSADIPTKNTIQPQWQADTTDLPNEDPLIRAGLAMKPSVYVDDVEAAGPQVLNRQFEQETFGHRALIHAHIQKDGQLWGILQPCMFDGPRHWTAPEKEQIEAILPRLQPLIAAYVVSA